MTIRSATTLETFFETGDYPTQEQFKDLIESTSNNLITGDVTVDLNNVATINPTTLSSASLKIYSAKITRAANAGAGVVTITTGFPPKFVNVTAFSSSWRGSIGTSSSINNNCIAAQYDGRSIVFLNYCFSVYDNTINGYDGIINNFTANSLDINFLYNGTGLALSINIDVIG